jgi:hypothetical protein
MSAFDVTSINAAGVLAFESSGLLESLKTNMASSSADTANSAMEMIKKLCEGNNCYLRSVSLSSSTSLLLSSSSLSSSSLSSSSLSHQYSQNSITHHHSTALLSPSSSSSYSSSS